VVAVPAATKSALSLAGGGQNVAFQTGVLDASLDANRLALPELLALRAHRLFDPCKTIAAIGERIERSIISG
jgi:predicted patatin/cPLA2 family phospholipase